jgi:hypothetical protein
VHYYHDRFTSIFAFVQAVDYVYEKLHSEIVE